MSRFKEQRRIDQALTHQNTSELQWALEYCESRLAIAPLKQHQKKWKSLVEKIQSVLETE